MYLPVYRKKNLNYIINVFIQNDSNLMLLCLTRKLVTKGHATGWGSIDIDTVLSYARKCSIFFYYDAIFENIGNTSYNTMYVTMSLIGVKELHLNLKYFNYNDIVKNVSFVTISTSIRRHWCE
jgi:hypothetical protein